MHDDENLTTTDAQLEKIVEYLKKINDLLEALQS